LVFERSDQAPFLFEPGQWVQLILPLHDAKDRQLRRSYSVASAPNGTPRFELAVTRVDEGLGSPFLHAAQPGLALDIKGPAGVFTRASDEAALFVATGSGVAPFRSMIADAVAKHRSAPMWLLFGVRSPDELLYGDEFHALARQQSQFRFEPTLSRPPAHWNERTGYVQAHVKSLWTELTAHHPAAHAYVCGVRKMLLAVNEVLRKELGVERKRVHLESYD
jgi:ferredoxin-NADP reductase